MQIITNKIEQSAPTTAAKTHRIVIIDCSGSMGGSLPNIRTALKNKIPMMVQPDDVLSIIWFSGRGEYGTLLEAVHISSLTDLSNVNACIDRFLKPVGMTAFVQPLEEIKALVGRVGMPSAMFFMTDGWDNSYSRKQIMDATIALSGVVDSSTFVEYGWYADHDLLAEMAEAVGGSLIQSTDFDKYVQQLETELSGAVGGKRVSVAVPSDVEYVVAPSSSGFIVSKAIDSVVSLPATCTEYTFVTGTGSITEITEYSGAMYTMAALVQRGKVDKAIEIAEVIGDVDIYQSLQNAFSKQDYANVVESLIDYANGTKTLYSTAPKSNKLAVKADAYNVLQMLIDLSSSEGNYLHIGHPSFKYSSIGAKQETAEVNGFVPKFVPKVVDVKAEISSLKFDEDRPNVSILVLTNGSVVLPETPLLANNTIDTFIWRNYTIIKDGIINMQYLPLILTAKMHKKLLEEGVINEPFVAGKTYVIDTKKMPVINRQMVEDVSANELAFLALQTYRVKCIQKVLNAKIKEEGLKVSKFVDIYGEEATNFLKEYGITEGGFSPKKVTVAGYDSYMSKELRVKLKGLSSIPSIADVEKAIAAKKNLTQSQQFLKEAMDIVDGVDDVLKEKNLVKARLQEMASKMVKIKFSVILGKKWFKEFGSMDENTTVLKVGSKDIQVTFELEEKQISQ